MPVVSPVFRSTVPGEHCIIAPCNCSCTRVCSEAANRYVAPTPSRSEKTHESCSHSTAIDVGAALALPLPITFCLSFTPGAGPRAFACPAPHPAVAPLHKHTAKTDNKIAIAFGAKLAGCSAPCLVKHPAHRRDLDNDMLITRLITAPTTFRTTCCTRKGMLPFAFNTAVTTQKQMRTVNVH